MSKTINIGAWKGEQQELVVDDNSTLSNALQQAGLTITNSQQVTSYSDGSNNELNDVVRDGETYLITGNHVSGR